MKCPALIQVIFILLLLASGTAFAEDFRYTLSFNGDDRDYIVHLPPSFRKGAATPVVLALHGGGGSGAQMQATYGLDAYADRAGMIVIYPDGVPAKIGKFHTWNAGACCGRAQRENSDDAGFLSALIDTIRRDYGAIASPVFVTGHSNGAMMAYRLACAIPEKITAIAPVGGHDIFECPRVKPLPVLHVHGTQDQCARYEGGASCGGCFNEVMGLPAGDGDSWPCQPVEVSLAERAASYGCAPSTEILYQQGAVQCLQWKNCQPGGGVTLCRITGGGHVWQGAAPPPFCVRNDDGRLCRKWAEATGPVLSGVDTNWLIFDFFSYYTNNYTPKESLP